MSDPIAADPVADPTPAPSGITAGVADAAPAPDPSPAPTKSESFSFYNDEGPNDEIVSKLPKSLQGIVSKYRSDDDLGKGIDHLKWMAGSKGFEPLAPDADEATRAKHNEILRNVNRVPESVDGYKVERPESYSEQEWEASSMGKYLETMHKHNASPEMVKDLVAIAGESMALAKEQMQNAAQQQVQEQTAALAEKYGNDVGKMAQAANSVANTFGLPLEQIQTVEMVEFLNNVKAAISEDKLTNSSTLLDDSGNYDAQADAIMSDPSNPFHADYNSGDRNREKRAQDEIIRLRNLAIKAKKGGN